MIPKIINYCWFGHNSKPKLVKKCIRSWHRLCPDYKIVEWNEENFDLESAPLFVRQAYDAGKWAFVTDYVRLWAVYNFGGLYFDTDIKLIKKPDSLLKNKSFFAREIGGRIATGLGFGSEKDNFILKELMETYEARSFLNYDGSYDLTVCGANDTKIFEQHGYLNKDELQTFDFGVIYPTEYFCTTLWNPDTDNTFTKNYYSGSWREQSEVRLYKSDLRKAKFKYYLGKLIQYPASFVKKLLRRNAG